jgi:hypothetical protein
MLWFIIALFILMISTLYKKYNYKYLISINENIFKKNYSHNMSSLSKLKKKPTNQRLYLSESFCNFEGKMQNNWWKLFNPFFDYIADDGNIIQKNDGVVLDSNCYTFKINHNGYTNMYHYAITSIIPYDFSANGVNIEFVVSQHNTNIKGIELTQFNSFYTNNNVDPEADLRLANSGILITSLIENTAYVGVQFTNKIIYFTYGIMGNSNSKNKFIVAIPVINRYEYNNDKMKFSICLNYDGSAQLFLLDEEKYINLFYINNIGLPPKDKKYIIGIQSNELRTDNTNKIKYEPITFNKNNGNLNILIGNFKAPQLFNPYNNDIRPFKSLHQCENDKWFINKSTEKQDYINNSSEEQLLFGQGAWIKMYEMNVFYIA